MMSNRGYVDLHLHSNYSIKDGIGKISELVKRTKELGRKSLAITDHGNLFGAIDFYAECQKQGIKPILGCEVYVAATNRFDLRKVEENSCYHLTLLASTNQGWNNLCKLVTLSYEEGFYLNPRIDLDLLEEYSEGIIALSGCIGGEIPQMLLRRGYEESKKAALKYKSIFDDHFCLEIQRNGAGEEEDVINGLVRLSKELDIKLVATNDVHYVTPQDAFSQNVMLNIRDGRVDRYGDRKVWRYGQKYIKSDEEMWELFSEYSEALENTIKIADMCSVNIEFNQFKMPKLNWGDVKSDTLLKRLCEEGLKKRYEEVSKEVRNRLEYELKVIRDMGFSDYFLIVQEYVKFAREKGYLVGPGRGSAVGSIVAYLLGIIQIDPLKYGLMFERFLNYNRKSMPDIDVDFEPEAREVVFNHLVERYGRDRVSKIVTFGSFGAKAYIQNICKVLALTSSTKDAILDLMTSSQCRSFKDIYNRKELVPVIENNPEIKRVLDIAVKLEGNPGQLSTHASGVLISDSRLKESIPLFTKDCVSLTQFDMNSCEKLGLVKVDILSLNYLTVLKDAMSMLDFSIELNQININDAKVYEHISNGETLGLFQLEGDGMSKFMRLLKPRNLEELAVGIALYRPGPMSFITNFLNVKNGNEEVTYIHEQLEPILKDTYGCIVYQEQVMEICVKLAGYTLAEADEFRVAIKKKDSEKMKQENDRFIAGSIENNIESSKALEIFNHIESFAQYAFPKSHALAYALLTYWTAYFKFNHTAEYMAAFMGVNRCGGDRLKKYINEAKRLGVKINVPNVNLSEVGICAINGEIYLGFSNISGISLNLAESIVQERIRNGEYMSLRDFHNRNDLTENELKNLILSGTFDCLGGTRFGYISVLKDLNMEEQTELTDKLDNVGEFKSERIAKFEIDLLGINLTNKLVNKEEVSKFINDTSLLKSTADIAYQKVENKECLVMCGLIQDLKIQLDRNNNRMAMFKLIDDFGEVRITIFSDIFKKFDGKLKDGMKVVVWGHAQISEIYGNSIIISGLKEFKVKNVEENAILYIKTVNF